MLSNADKKYSFEDAMTCLEKPYGLSKELAKKITEAKKAGNENCLNVQDRNGNTALHLIVYTCFYSESTKDIIDFFIENAKVDVNLKDFMGSPPISSAILMMQGDCEMLSYKRTLIKKLLERDDLNINAIRDGNGETALHVLIKNMITPMSINKEKGRLKVYKKVFDALIAKRIKVSIEDKNGKTALDLLRSKVGKDCVKLDNMSKEKILIYSYVENTLSQCMEKQKSEKSSGDGVDDLAAYMEEFSIVQGTVQSINREI